jgi:hypothetical protein
MSLVVVAGVLWLLCGVLVFVIAGDRDTTGIALGLSSWGIAVALLLGHRVWWLARLRRGAIPADEVDAAAAAETRREARRREDTPVRWQIAAFLSILGGLVAGLVVGALAFPDDPGDRVWLCGVGGAYLGGSVMWLVRRRTAGRSSADA